MHGIDIRNHARLTILHLATANTPAFYCVTRTRNLNNKKKRIVLQEHSSIRPKLPEGLAEGPFSPKSCFHYSNP